MTPPMAMLAIIFNHRFERNVSMLETYYGPRFQLRRYIIPFAKEPSEKVIRVVENGFTFSGHIWQAIDSLIHPDVTHYIFAGDDLILNPRWDETNLITALGLDENTGYIKSLVPIDNLRYAWAWAARTTVTTLTPGFDYKRELPAPEKAQQRFEAMGMKFLPPRPRSMQDVLWIIKSAFTRKFVVSIMLNIFITGRKTPYPFLSGYSDFVVVPAKAMQKFGEYCAVFAAMNLFAEVAVPTALALACDRVQTELALGEHFADADARRRPGATLTGKELWGQPIDDFAARYQMNWDWMIAEFPPDQLYVHPVKLSRWQSPSGALNNRSIA